MTGFRGWGSRTWVVGSIVVALVGAGCDGEGDGNGTDGEPATQPITLGLLTDLTGPVRTFGIDVEAAIRLAVEEINADGGINGSEVRLEVIDTSLQPEEAVQGLRELEGESEAVAVIGPVSSTEAEVIFTQAAQLEIPVITATANQPGLTELGQGWAFRNTPTAFQAYAAALPLYAAEYGVTSVALVYDEMQAGPTATAEQVVPAVAGQAGIEVVDTSTIQTEQTDYASVVQRVGDSGAEGLFMMSLPVEAGLFAREMDRQGVELPVLGFAAQGSSAFRETGGDAIRDWVVPIVFFPPAAGEAGLEFAAKMEEADPEPPTVPEAANAYEIVYMIQQVAQDAEIDGGTAPEEARQAIRDGLLGLEGFEGPTGTTTFLPNGDSEKDIYTLVFNGEETERLE
jgi:branched-chain amino acid transport system substrate-binding protein